MDTWRSVLSLTVAGLLLAGPALAQSSAPSTTDTPKSGPTGQDPTKPADSSSPAAAPSTAPKSDASQPDATKSDAQKADRQKKSDTMKSEGMKSDAQKSESKAGAVRGSREQVKSAQQALKDKGHDPGAIDGAMGPQTQSALKDFQKAQGLTETGRLDAETMAKLGVEAKASQVESSSPSASPKTTPGGTVRQEPGPAQDKQSPGKSQTR